MKSLPSKRKSPKTSAEIADLIAGKNQHKLDAAVRRAVKEAISASTAAKKRRLSA